MSKFVRSFEHIVGPAERILAERTGMLQFLRIGTLTIFDGLESLDEIVGIYNTEPVGPQLHRDTPHLVLAKSKLSAVPTVEDMTHDPSTGFLRNYIRALHTMNAAMQRAEKGEPEPNLGFANGWPAASPEERLFGGMLHGYGLTLGHWRHSELPGSQLEPGFHADKDMFLDALVETAALAHTKDLPNNRLHQLSETMGWYDATDATGRPIFSTYIRELVGSTT